MHVNLDFHFSKSQSFGRATGSGYPKAHLRSLLRVSAATAVAGFLVVDAWFLRPMGGRCSSARRKHRRHGSPASSPAFGPVANLPPPNFPPPRYPPSLPQAPDLAAVPSNDGGGGGISAKGETMAALPYAHVDGSLRALAGQAEGFGRHAIGGLNGSVFHVTSLDGMASSIIRARARTLGSLMLSMKPFLCLL